MLLFGEKKFFFTIKEMCNKNIISLNIERQIINYQFHTCFRLTACDFKFIFNSSNFVILCIKDCTNNI